MQIFIRTILLGIVSGSVYALASTGLVLTYKASGVLNFGYGALALFTTFVHWQLCVGLGLPVWLSALIVVGVVAPTLGVLLDRQLFRRIEGQPQIIGVIATVGLLVLLQGVVTLIWGGQTKNVPSIFPRGTLRLPFGVNMGVDQLGVLLVAAAAAGGLGAMLRYTKLGIAFRAVVNNRPIAGLMGINTGVVSGLAWALGTSFAALMGILLTPRLLLDPNFLPPFIIAFVLGASVIGYLRSLPLAYAGGLLIGIAQALFVQYGSGQGLLGKISDALPFLLITGALLLAPKALRAAGQGASFVVRTREAADRTSARARAGVAVAVFGGLSLVPLFGSASSTQFLTVGLIQSIVFLSLVVLTGYSGQISLGHTAFMGIAAFSAAHLVQTLHAPGWIAFLLGALAAVPAGAAIGLIAVRLQGLFLALMTLAFAFMAQSLFFEHPSFSGGEGGIAVLRPAGFHGDTAFFYLSLAALAAASALAINLRTGRTGRVLAGMRDSETACRSLGISVTRYKVLIFGISAFIAGIGGVLFGMIQEQATSRSFIPFYSLIFMTLAVLGGIFHVGGAITAGLVWGLYPMAANTFPFLNRIQLILFGLGATVALAKNPEGMFGELRRAGAIVLRAIDRRAAAQPTVDAIPAVSGGSE